MHLFSRRTAATAMGLLFFLSPAYAGKKVPDLMDALSSPKKITIRLGNSSGKTSQKKAAGSRKSRAKSAKKRKLSQPSAGMTINGLENYRPLAASLTA
jgi:hypothetical protein